MMKIRVLFLSLTLILLFPGRSLAQTTPEVATVEISQVDNSAYPEVTLYVRILDAAGNRVPNLTQDQFRVTEDGQTVELTAYSSVNQEAITTFLLIDVSGSMDEDEKIQGAKEAALTLVAQMRPQDQVALIAFNDTVFTLQPLTTDREAIQAQIRALNAEGGTAWYDAVYQAANDIAPLVGRKSILLLTDGIDEDSRRTFQEAIDAAQVSGSPLYSFGFGPTGQYDENALTRIADVTGGEFFHAPTASELEDLYRELSQATQDEYVLTYHSPRPDYDGTRRDIQVEVSGAGGSAAYVETHLLTIQSDLLIGILFLIPLLMAVFVPLVGQYVYGIWRAGQKVQPVQPVTPLPVAPPPVYPPARPPAQPSPAPPSPAPFAGPAAQTCASCGRAIRAGAQFCAGCGKAVAPPAPPPAPAVQAFCPHCHQPVRSGARFCGKCGQSI